MNLNVTQKFELTRKLENGKIVAQICDEYGIKKQTVSDIRKAKDKLRNYAANFCVDVPASKAKDGPRKHMKMGKDMQLAAAVMKWYVQQKSSGMYIQGMEILAAASEFAEHLGIANFKGSDGWLWCFCKHHGLFNVKVHGEVDSVEPFRLQLIEAN